MLRTVLAVVAVSLAAVAPSSEAVVRDAQLPVADSYIVVLKADAARSDTEAHSTRPRVAAVAQELARGHGGEVTAVYQYALKGFAVRLSASRADALAGDSRVDYVERDQVFEAVGTESPATWG